MRNYPIPCLLLLLTFTGQCRGAAAANDCLATVTDPSVRHFDVRLPAMRVPESSMTTYVCQFFKVPLPLDRDYHAVAFLPLIDNRDVMHHMILFSCDGGGLPAETTQPHDCSPADNTCRAWMAQWSLGVDGLICPHHTTGVRFGRSVGQYLLAQIHWNNGQFLHNLTDQSGFRVFYTADLRPYDLGHVQVGQQEIIIPAGVSRHAQSGGCSAECTQMLLPEPLYITQAHLHMHHLGSGGWLNVVRRDGDVTQVFLDDTYDYNHPAVHRLSTPVTVFPGDYMEVTCLYSSKEGTQKRNRTVFFGEGSDGEMCYVFMEYYPHVKGFDQCIELGNHDVNCPSSSNAKFRFCTSGFLTVMTSQFLPDVIASCNKSQDGICHDGCKQSLDAMRSQECFQGTLGGYVERELLPRLAKWDAVLQYQREFSRLCGIDSVM